MTLKKVVYVAVLVSDQDKALDFYTNLIGLEKRGDYPTPNGPRFLTVGVNGQDLGPKLSSQPNQNWVSAHLLQADKEMR